jgi:hypothetical protein
MKMHMKKLLFVTTIVLSGILISSCHWSDNRHMKRSVSKEELVGTWMATPFSMKCLKETGHKEYLKIEDHRLVLYEDGACKFKSMQNVNLASDSGIGYRYVLK